MNTPAHAVLNIYLIGRKAPINIQAAILAGALLPDAPMFLFYGIEKLILHQPEHLIWSQRFFLPAWQGVFSSFNSFFFISAGWLMAHCLRAPSWQFLFLSMGLHALCDLPLHNADAHRHFYPLTDWRFHSPVSYWDPAHHGGLVTLVEIGLVLICSALLLYGRGASRFIKGTIGTLGALYVIYFGYVLWVWV